MTCSRPSSPETRTTSRAKRRANWRRSSGAGRFILVTGRPCRSPAGRSSSSMTGSPPAARCEPRFALSKGPERGKSSSRSRSHPNSAGAHFIKGQVLRAQSRPEDAIFEYEMTITLNHNHAAAYHYLGACKLLTGAVEEVIPLEVQVLRLSPRDHDVGGRCWYIGAVHLLRS